MSVQHSLCFRTVLQGKAAVEEERVSQIFD